jgi:hypothetical protein
MSYNRRDTHIQSRAGLFLKEKSASGNVPIFARVSPGSSVLLSGSMAYNRSRPFPPLRLVILYRDDTALGPLTGTRHFLHGVDTLG